MAAHDFVALLALLLACGAIYAVVRVAVLVRRLAELAKSAQTQIDGLLTILKFERDRTARIEAARRTPVPPPESARRN